MSSIRKHPYLFGVVLGSLGLILFLLLTNPQEVSIGLLIVPVVLLFLIIFSIAQIVIKAFNLMKGNPGKKRITALISAGLITMVMILQSTGGISGADVILLALIIIVSAVYVEKF